MSNANGSDAGQNLLLGVVSVLRGRLQWISSGTSAVAVGEAAIPSGTGSSTKQSRTEMRRRLLVKSGES
jgi:hypothetical protein